MKTAIIAGILLPLAAFAQRNDDARFEQRPLPMGTPRMMNAHDREFVMKAASAGMFEVKAAQLALEKSKDDQVKSISQHLITDHTSANEKLNSVAQTEGVALPRQMLPEHQRMYDKLMMLSGKDFDREYLTQQKQTHEEVLALFQKQAAMGQNLALRSFAEQTLPTLRMHHSMVMRAAQTM